MSGCSGSLHHNFIFLLHFHSNTNTPLLVTVVYLRVLIVFLFRCVLFCFFVLFCIGKQQDNNANRYVEWHTQAAEGQILPQNTSQSNGDTHPSSCQTRLHATYFHLFQCSVGRTATSSRRQAEKRKTQCLRREHSLSHHHVHCCHHAPPVCVTTISIAHDAPAADSNQCCWCAAARHQSTTPILGELLSRLPRKLPHPVRRRRHG